jgi:AcrR family transcriptional regulator
MTTSQDQELTPAGQRILDVASRLFYEQGIRAVGVEMIAREADVTKKTIYDRFGSKDALIERYLQTRDDAWRKLILDRINQDDLTPEEQILTAFESLHEWLDQEIESRGCSFINAYAELLADPGHPGRAVIEGEKRWLRELFLELVTRAGFDEPDALATQLHMLHEGAYIAYAITDIPDAALQARNAAAVLIAK